MDSEFERARDALYRVFQRYERPEWFTGCGCCWNSRDVLPGDHYQGGDVRVRAPGGNRPVRELAMEELCEVAENVPHLGGGVDVFRHYLPRLLDLALTAGFDWTDPEAVVARIAYGPELGSAPWWTWPPDEQEAISRFFEAVWAHNLRQPDGCVDTLLCCVGTTVADVSSYLDKWLAFDEPFAARHLAAFLVWNDELRSGQLSNPFWGPDNARAVDNMRLVVRWANSAQTLMAVRRALDGPAADEELTALRACIERLGGNGTFASNPLERAVEEGDAATVSILLARGLDPNSADSVTSNPLWELAFLAGRQELVAAFAAAGADLDRKDDRGATVLHRAVGAGTDVGPVLQLLDLGVALDEPDRFGWTALHVASAYGHTDIARALLDRGARPDRLTAQGRTPLDFAITNNHYDLVELLSDQTKNRRADA